MKKLFDTRVVIIEMEMAEGEASEEILNSYIVDAYKELSIEKVYLGEYREDAVLAALTDFFNQKNVREKGIDLYMIDENVMVEDEDVNTTYHYFKFNEHGEKFKGLCIEVIVEEHLFSFIKS